MHSHRPLAITATALSAVLLGALALSGCTTSGAAGFAVGPAVAGDDHPTVAVIGDSIESGMNLDPDEAWPALIAVDRRWGVQNHSVPGAGFLALGPDGRTFDAQVDEAIADDADVVLIGASDNDLGEDTSAVASAMTKAVERLRDALPDAHILGFNALTGEASDDDLAPLNDALRAAVTAVGGRWLDLGQPYRGQAGLVQDDGEHPTPAGQQAIAATVLERLDARV